MKIRVRDSLKITGKVIFTFQNVYTGKIRRSIYNNLVTNTGKQMLAKRLANEANACNITYGALGTGVTAPNVNDTQLETEYIRKTVSSYSYAGNIATVSAYFGPTEGNTTLKEYSLFGEAASSTPDSGTMFNRVAINETKTVLETLTVDCEITIA